jgi:hypothetical protein
MRSAERTERLAGECCALDDVLAASRPLADSLNRMRMPEMKKALAALILSIKRYDAVMGR